MSRIFEAHESFWSDFKMTGQMLKHAILIGVIIQLLFLGWIFYSIEFTPIFTDAQGTKVKMPGSVFLRYHTFIGNLHNEIALEKEIVPYAQGWTKLPQEQYMQFVNWLVNGEYSAQQEYLVKYLKLSFSVYSFSLLYLFIFARKSKQMDDSKFVRGAKLTPLKLLRKKLAGIAKTNRLSTLTIAGMLIPFEMESKHFLVLGSTGVGKGIFLNQFISEINSRIARFGTNERLIVYDPKGEFLSKQGQEHDCLFNPFDERSLGWNIFNEIEIMPDFDVVTKSLFASNDAKDSYWYNCAGDVFRTGLVWLERNNKKSNNDLWNFFSQPLAGIQAAFKTLPPGEQGALKHIDSSDSPASASIISILQERIQFFRYLKDLDGPFSFRKYVRGEIKIGNLFIVNIEQYASIFKPLMTLAVDTMARETLSLPDDLNRRIWFIIDEIGNLGRMDSIITLETVGRSKGAALVCANQDLGRIEEQYGRANLKSFFNNFNTTLTFCIREPETAEFLSRAIGEQVLVKSSQSRQMSPGDIGDRKSISEAEKTERLILPSEIQDLPVRHAILNVAGLGTTKIVIPEKYFDALYDPFVLRKFTEIKPAVEPVQAVAADEPVAVPAQDIQEKAKNRLKA